jgi:hypothetical protein
MIEVMKVQKHYRVQVQYPFVKVYHHQIGMNRTQKKNSHFISYSFSLEVQAEVSDCKSFDIESITISEKSSKTMDSLKALAGSIK